MKEPPAAPTITPATGAMTNADPLTVTMTTETEDATIKYLLDQTETPSAADHSSWTTCSGSYTFPTTLEAGTYYLHAISVKGDLESESVTTAGPYTFTVLNPSISFAEQSVTVSLLDIDEDNQVAGMLPTLSYEDISSFDASKVTYTSNNDAVVKVFGNALRLRGVGQAVITATYNGNAAITATYTLTVEGPTDVEPTKVEADNRVNFDTPGVLKSKEVSVTGLTLQVGGTAESAVVVSHPTLSTALKAIDGNGFSFVNAGSEPPTMGTFFKLTPTETGTFMAQAAVDNTTRLYDATARTQVTPTLNGTNLTALLEKGHEYYLYNTATPYLYLHNFSYKIVAAPTISVDDTDLTNGQMEYYAKDLTATVRAADATANVYFKWASAPLTAAQLLAEGENADLNETVTTHKGADNLVLSALAVTTVNGVSYPSGVVTLTLNIAADPNHYYMHDYNSTEPKDQTGTIFSMNGIETYYRNEIAGTEGFEFTRNGGRSITLEMGSSEKTNWWNPITSNTYFIEFDAILRANEMDNELAISTTAYPTTSYNLTTDAASMFRLYSEKQVWKIGSNVIGLPNTTTDWIHFKLTVDQKGKNVHYTISNKATGQIVSNGDGDFALADATAIMKGFRYLFGRNGDNGSKTNNWFYIDNIDIWGIATLVTDPTVEVVTVDGQDPVYTYSYNEEKQIAVASTETGVPVKFIITDTETVPNYDPKTWWPRQDEAGKELMPDNFTFTMGEDLTSATLSVQNYGDFYVHAISVKGSDVSHVVSSAKFTFNPPTVSITSLSIAEGADADGKKTADAVKMASVVTVNDEANPAKGTVATWYRWDNAAQTLDNVVKNTTAKQSHSGGKGYLYFTDENVATRTVTARGAFYSLNGQVYLGNDIKTLTVSAPAIAEADKMVLSEWTFKDEETTPTVDHTCDEAQAEGGLLKLSNSKASGSRAAQAFLYGKAPEEVNNLYFVEFDARLNHGSAGDNELTLLAESRTGSSIYAFSSAEVSNGKQDDCLFRLTGNKTDGTKWYLNATNPTTGVTDRSEPSLTLTDGAWYHFKFAISKSDKAVTYQIFEETYSAESVTLGNLIATGSYTRPNNIEAEVVRFVLNRTQSAENANGLDNLKVWIEKPKSEDDAYFFFTSDRLFAELIDLRFNEPELKNGYDMTTNNRYIAWESGSENVARMDSDNPGDVLFINTGITSITAKLMEEVTDTDGNPVTDTDGNPVVKQVTDKDGNPVEASYSVTVRADDANYEISSDGQTYTLTGTGKLSERVVNQLPGIKMYFGNEPADNLTSTQKQQGLDNGTIISNTTIVRNESVGIVATTLERRGWRHMRPVVNENAQLTNPIYNPVTLTEPVDQPLNAQGNALNLADGDVVVPAQGTYYRFEAQTDGHLSFTGASSADNAVVLYNETTKKFVVSNSTGYTEVSATDLYGHYEEYASNTSSLPLVHNTSKVTVSDIPLKANNNYLLFAHVPHTGGYAVALTYRETAEDGTATNYDVYEVTADDNTVTRYYKHGDTWKVYDADTKALVNAATTPTGAQQVMTEKWAMFQLTSFTYKTDFYFTTRHYRNKQLTDDASFQQTVNGADQETKYTVKAIGDMEASIDETSGQVTVTRKQGGALIITATNKDGYEVSYAVTYPYVNHKWEFYTDHRDADAETKYGRMTTKQLFEATNNWGVTYKVRNYDDVTRALSYLNKPVQTNELTVDGDNVLYIEQTAGLIVKAESKTFGTNVSIGADGLWNGQEPQAWVNSQMGEGKKWANSTDGEYVEQLDFALKTMLSYKKNAMEKPHELTIQKGAAITIPDLTTDHYIILRMNRHSGNSGQWLTFNNSNGSVGDAMGKAITSRFGITGLVTDSNNEPLQKYKDTDGKTLPMGSYVFKVLQAGDVSITIDDTGWTDFYDIEIRKGSFDTEMRLLNDKDEVVDITNSSYSHVGTPTKDKPLTITVKAGHSASLYPRGGAEDFEVTAVEGDLTVVEGSTTRLSGGTYSFDITGGHRGIVRIRQKAHDTGLNWVSNYEDTYLAIGTVTPQTYPMTWDFTDRNSMTKHLPKNTGETYAGWTVNAATLDNAAVSAVVRPSVEVADAGNLRGLTPATDDYQDVAKTVKPTFASGAELTNGLETLAETIGLGVGLTAGLADSSITLRGQDGDETQGLLLKAHEVKRVTVGADTQELVTSETKSVPELTIPGVRKGQKVYVKVRKGSDNGVPVPSLSKVFRRNTTEEVEGACSEREDMNSTSEADSFGAFGFDITGNGDLKLQFANNDEVEILAVGVTDVMKTVGTTGFATESRLHDIDHRYTGEFTKNDVNAYIVYNGEYDTATKSVLLLEQNVIPENTGAILYISTKPSAAISVPLFYPANNVTGSSADNLLVACPYGNEVVTKTTGDRTNFILSTSGFSRNNPNKTIQGIGFYRLAQDGILGQTQAAAANKSYLSLPNHMEDTEGTLVSTSAQRVYMRVLSMGDRPDEVVLLETATEMPEISPNANVTVERTMKTTSWNTFCLPFDMDVPEGWQAMEPFSSKRNDEGKLEVGFLPVDRFVAGMPYIVKPAADYDGSICANNVTVLPRPRTAKLSGLTMVSNYVSTEAPRGSYIISNNQFYYVNSAVALKGFRAYFETDDPAQGLGGFFIDDTLTAIDSADSHQSLSGSVYDLQGRKVADSPATVLKPGLYIMNGKKFVVK